MLAAPIGSGCEGESKNRKFGCGYAELLNARAWVETQRTQEKLGGDQLLSLVVHLVAGFLGGD